MNYQKKHEPDPATHAPRFVFIQLNRLGDLIQSCIIAQELKKLNPQFKINLIARSIFYEPLKEILLENFDKVYPIGMTNFLNNEISFSENQEIIYETINEINSQPVDIVINQTFSRSSACLTSLIQCTHKFGMYLNNTGDTQIADKWSQYIHSHVMSGAFNSINLNDIFRLLVGLKPSLKKATSNPDSCNISINPFSSHSKKSWRLEKWTEVIYQILKREDNASIYLLSSKEESHLINRLASTPLLESYRDRIKLQTTHTLIETFNIIKNSRFYLGHDSLCANLASIAQKKAVIIALGTVRADETQPEGEGNIILSPRTSCFPCFPNDDCDNYKCHSDIHYNLVSEIAIQLFQHDEVSKDKLLKNCNPYQLFSCEFKYVSQNKLSLLQQSHSQLEQELNLSAYVRNLYRVCALFINEGIEETLGEGYTVFPKQSELEAFQHNMTQFHDLCVHGKMFCFGILEEVNNTSPSIQVIKDLGAKVDEVDQLIIKLKEISPFLSPLCHALVLRKTQLGEGHLVHLTEKSFLIYNELVLYSKTALDLIESTLALKQYNKPSTQFSQRGKMAGSP